MLMTIIMIGFVVIPICIFVGFIVGFVNCIKETMYIREYRKTNQWNPKAPEHLKYQVILNEEYGVLTHILFFFFFA